MQHFFPSFIYLLSLSLSLSHRRTHPTREKAHSSPVFSLFLLLFVVLSVRRHAHTTTRAHAVTLSRNCQKFPISRDFFFFKWCSLAHTDGVLVCLLICLLVCSHKSAAAGALQRNFLPFIAQHIFFGIFFRFFYAFRCLLGGLDTSFTRG